MPRAFANGTASDMPTRIVRDDILTNEAVNSLSPNAELFYRRLMSVADDHGRYSAHLTQLRAFCYPLKLDSVKEDSIKKHLAECVDAGLIVLFTVESKGYLEIQNFGQRINGKSKFPEPPQKSPGNPGEVPENSGNPRLGVGGDEVEGGLFASDPQAVPSPTVIQLPLADKSEFPITQAVVDELSELYPGVDVPSQLRAMRGWCVGNPTKRKTKKGIMRFVTNWLSGEQDKPKKPASPGNEAPRMPLL